MNGAQPGQWLEAGVRFHQSGDLEKAAAEYQRVLGTIPGQADALHLLGVVRHQTGDHAEAVRLIRKSVKNNAKNADAHSNLGAALAALGENDAARMAFQRAVSLNPQAVDARANLAVLAVRNGDINAAIKQYEAAHKAQPGEARFLRRLAELTLEAERFSDARAWYEAFLTVAPGDAAAWNDLGFALERTGDIQEAGRAYGRAADIAPDQPEFSNNHASILRRMGRLDEAEQRMKSALEIPMERWSDPAHFAGALFNASQCAKALALYQTLLLDRNEDAMLHAEYGAALLQSGQRDEAQKILRQAVALDGGLDSARIDLAHCLLHDRKADAAAAILKEVRPDSASYLPASLDLSLVLAGAEKFDEACEAARAAINDPRYRSGLSNKPYSVFRGACSFDDLEQYSPDLSAISDPELPGWAATFLDLLVWADQPDKVDGLVRLHRRWGERLTGLVAGEVPAARPAGSGKGKIRLGFLSSDLRRHSVARFVLPLFENYDRDEFDIFCYAPAEDRGDVLQNRIRGLVSDFRIVADMTHGEIAETIRADGIDVLFELNGFTADSKMMVMAYRPAPIQIYWLGYPFTTGLPGMDYILVDPHVAPRDETTLVEEPLAVPGCWVCYAPFEETTVNPEPPGVRNGAVTFGTLNNPYKFTRERIALWGRIMNAAPGSRCLLSHPAYAHPAIVRNISREFERAGVAPDRLRFMNNRDSGISHFMVYEDIDITLDTFPLTGGTTTCDALWMGVPTVTQVGPAMHQRLSNSHLQNAGLPELCAPDAESFVDAAVALASDPDRLAGIRAGLRDRVLASPLGDAKRFSEDFCATVRGVVRSHGLR